MSQVCPCITSATSSCLSCNIPTNYSCSLGCSPFGGNVVCVFSKRVGEVSLVLYPASFYISFMSWASSYFINGLNGGCWCPLVCWHPSLLLTCKKDTCVVLRSHPRHFLIFFTSNTELTQTLPFFFRYQSKSQLTLTWQLSPLYAWRLITISDRVWILCRYGPGTIAFKKCN